MIDQGQKFMITVSIDDQSASVQHNWNPKFIKRMLDAFMLDNQSKPLYQDITEADFYGIISKVQGLCETNYELFEKYHFNIL